MRNHKGKIFIGYYNLANYITILGMSSAVCAICFAVKGRTEYDPIWFKVAIMALLLAGLTDMFDGRVARHANRQDQKSKMFGIQIDTVCDMVSFGVAPAAVAYCFGLNEWYDYLILVLYTFGGAFRLAYFNTQAIMETEDMNLKVFTGVPIPTICFVIAPIAVCMTFFSWDVMQWVLRGFYFALAFLFISNIKIKKPKLLVCIIIVAVLLAAVTALALCDPMNTPFTCVMNRA